MSAGILDATFMSDRDKRIVNEKMTTVEINALIKAKIKVGGGPLMPKAPGGGCGF